MVALATICLPVVASAALVGGDLVLSQGLRFMLLGHRGGEVIQGTWLGTLRPWHPNQILSMALGVDRQ